MLRESGRVLFVACSAAEGLRKALANEQGCVRYMNAAKYGLDRVFFGGCFIRGGSGAPCRDILADVKVGHAATISTLSYAIRFWSKGTMRACFLRHEGFL